MAHPHYQIIIAVPVEVGDGASQSALARQLGSAEFTKGICVDVGRWALPVVLAVAEDEIEVAVAVEVVLVNALQYAAEGNAQVLPRIAKVALAKVVEAARGLGSSH